METTSNKKATKANENMKGMLSSFTSLGIVKVMSIAGMAFFFASLAAPQHKAPWNIPESAKERKNPFAADESSISRGKESYKTECMRCHGNNGRGDGPNAVKLSETVADLSSSEVQSQTDGTLFCKISEGRRPMPVAKRTLTDDQRWDVINYIRTFSKR